MQERETIISYKAVRICREEHILLEDFTLEVRQGEFVYLTGAVGAGKSSLLKTLYAELPVTEGEARVLGYDLTRLKRKHIPSLRQAMGIVFQDFQLLPDSTAYDNLDIVLRALGYRNSAERKERIAEVLSAVALEHKGYKYPHELSGGEQQRIAIARAILGKPSLIIADEPTANLDAESGRQVAELLHRIAQETGTAVLMATHNLQILEAFPARVIAL